MQDIKKRLSSQQEAREYDHGSLEMHVIDVTHVGKQISKDINWQKVRNLIQGTKINKKKINKKKINIQRYKINSSQY